MIWQDTSGNAGTEQVACVLPLFVLLTHGNQQSIVGLDIPTPQQQTAQVMQLGGFWRFLPWYWRQSFGSMGITTDLIPISIGERRQP